MKETSSKNLEILRQRIPVGIKEALSIPEITNVSGTVVKKCSRAYFLRLKG